MSFTFCSTFGSSIANAYVSLADADDILTNEVINPSYWTDASTITRQAALVTATRAIDGRNWHGTRYFFKQALQFPRVPPGAVFPYGATSYTEADAAFFDWLAQDEYLTLQKSRVEKACAIQALHLIRIGGRDLERESQALGIGSESSSQAGISSSKSYSGRSTGLHPDVMDLLRYYKATPRLVRGSGQSSRYY